MPDNMFIQLPLDVVQRLLDTADKMMSGLKLTPFYTLVADNRQLIQYLSDLQTLREHVQDELAMRSLEQPYEPK